MSTVQSLSKSPLSGNHWNELASKVLRAEDISRSDAVHILESSDEELLDLLAATFRVRRHFSEQPYSSFF